jgi:L-histidine N-alpha-methyltransferase
MAITSDISQTGQLQIFLGDVLAGLACAPKTLPCKWFYDAIGSALFERITATDDYYPTRVETRLLEQVVIDLRDFLPDLVVIVEPGSGSSAKTRRLLASQPKLQQYIPIDISGDFLLNNARQLHHEFPQLSITPVVDDFTCLRKALPIDSAGSRLIFFPGSTIGNFDPAQAERLLCNLRDKVKDAYLLIGVDMTQDSEKLLAAYDDRQGVTALFNLNLLERCNRELEADFAVERFRHEARLDRRRQRVEMHLVSQTAQAVTIDDRTFSFRAGESIHTENSYKYDEAAFRTIAARCGWHFVEAWRDRIESEFGVFLFRG